MLLIVERTACLDPHDREATLPIRGWSAEESEGTEVGHLFDVPVGTFEGVREGSNLSVLVSFGERNRKRAGMTYSARYLLFFTTSDSFPLPGTKSHGRSYLSMSL